MPDPHDVALFAMTAGCAVGALLMSDAAEAAIRGEPMAKRRPASPWSPRRLPVWARPAALQCIGLGFLGGMATSGVFLMMAIAG